MNENVETYSVKPIGYRVRCPKCNEGFMKTQEVEGIKYFARLQLGDSGIPHKCTKCGYEEKYKKEYPYVEFVSDE